MVEELAKTCAVYQDVTENHYRDVAINKLAFRPFKSIAVVCAGPFSIEKYFLRIIDECSGYPFCDVLSSTKFSCLEPIIMKIWSLVIRND